MSCTKDDATCVDVEGKRARLGPNIYPSPQVTCNRINKKHGLFVTATGLTSMTASDHGPKYALSWDRLGYREQDVDAWAEAHLARAMNLPPDRLSAREAGCRQHWMVVFEDDHTRHYAEKTLNKFGADTCAASNFFNAARFAQTEEIDAVWFEVGRNMDGAIALADVLMWRGLPYLALSNVFSVPRAISCGGRVLQSPFTSRKVAEAIRDYMPELRPQLDLSAVDADIDEMPKLWQPSTHPATRDCPRWENDTCVCLPWAPACVDWNSLEDEEKAG